MSPWNLVSELRSCFVSRERIVWSAVLCAAVCIFSGIPAKGIETVRVDASSGAPRLMVDGNPVRSRMFWGAPGAAPIPVGTSGQEVAFEFSPAQDAQGSATMHFRFGGSPGTVDLDAIRVFDLTAGQDLIPAQNFEQGMQDFEKSWTFWPPGPQNTTATLSYESGRGLANTKSLRITLKAPPSGTWPDFHIYHHSNLVLKKEHRYRVTFWAKAEPARDLTVAFYQPGQTYTYLGGPPSLFEGQIEMAAKVGVNFVSFPVNMPWPEPGEKPDWSASDAQCRAVLDANPHALLLPRIGVEPPDWWSKAHPDEMMVWDKPGPDQRGAVVASPLYRHDACEQLAALVRHLEEKFGAHVAGYHPCGQNTGEWFYQQTWADALNGYAKADVREWRVWLQRHYADDAALQAAWKDSKATRAGAEVPASAERRAAPDGVLHDPQRARKLIDFAAYQQDAMADCVCELAKSVRDASQGKKLVVFFYGYVFEFGAIHNGAGTAGHYALRRALSSPDIDVLCSPISYFDRGMGQSAPAMTAAESVALAGKMWLYEDDTRTYLGTGQFPGWTDGVTTIEDTNRELLRNTAQCAVRNFGTWWMDLGATGWFHDARMWAEMERLSKLDEPLLQHPRPFRPEVAAVIDETSMMRLAAGGVKVGRPGIYEVRAPLGRMGAPYGQYLQDDVLAGKVSAKVFVFLDAWSVPAADRQKLLAATRDSLRVWCYAPGYQEGDRISADGMQQLTGFQLRPVQQKNGKCEPTAAGKQLGLTAGFGVDQPVKPLFAAVDAKPEETLAVWPDGSAAVALRRLPDGWSLFVGPPGLTSELLRIAAKRANAHLFTDADCNVYRNGPYLVLHASKDGDHKIDTAGNSPVVDLLTGKTIANGPRFTLPLKKGDTRVLQIGE